jgi:hypothetical protein
VPVDVFRRDIARQRRQEEVVVQPAVLRPPPAQAVVVADVGEVGILAQAQSSVARRPREDRLRVDSQAPAHVVLDLGEALDGVDHDPLALPQPEVRSQVPVGQLVDAGDDGAAQVEGDTVRLTVVERRKNALAGFHVR